MILYRLLCQPRARQAAPNPLHTSSIALPSTTGSPGQGSSKGCQLGARLFALPRYLSDLPPLQMYQFFRGSHWPSSSAHQSLQDWLSLGSGSIR